MPEQFTKTSDGGLSIVNGINAALAFDTDTGSLRPAGVRAPTETPTLAFSGTGTITGDYYAYVRYIDRYNQPSNLSPISLVATAAAALTATYGNLPVPSQTTIVRRQILRNTAGQATTFYVDIDTTDLVSTTLSSTRTDSELQVQEAVPILFSDGRPAANRYWPPPDHCPFSASHLNRLWLAGIEPYREGAAKVVFGSATVTGIGTQWFSTFAGRQFFTGNAVYDVVSVDEAAQTLTLDRPYESISAPYQRYCIQPPLALQQSLYFSESGQPEAFSITEALVLNEDGGPITGLMPLNSFLYILKHDMIYKFTGQNDPSTDGVVYFDSNRGCVNNRCWQIVNGMAYILDQKGIYSFTGGEFESVSDSISTIFQDDSEFYGIQWSQSRFFHSVHYRAAGVMKWFVAMGGGYLPLHAICLNYSTGMWWVERYNRRIGASVAGERPLVSSTWRAANREQLYYGLDAKQVGAYGVCNLDGANDDPFFAGNVSGSTFDTITLTADVSIPVNAAILITRGPGIGQVRRVVEILSSNRVRVEVPWAVRPTENSEYQVAGIKATYRTGRMFRRQNESNEVSRMTFHWRPANQPPAGIPRGPQKQYKPTSPAYGAIRLYDGWETKPVDQQANQSIDQYGGALVETSTNYILADMTAPAGFISVRDDYHRSEQIRGMRTTTLELTVISGSTPIGIRQIDVTAGLESSGGPA